MVCEAKIAKERRKIHKKEQQSVCTDKRRAINGILFHMETIYLCTSVVRSTALPKIG